MPNPYCVVLPGSEGVMVWSDGRVTYRGEEFDPEPYSDGGLRFRIEAGTYLWIAPAWKVMLQAFYFGERGDCQPTFKDGDRRNHSLDNLVFVHADPETGDWVPKRYREMGYFRKFDSRLGQRIRILETGETFDSLQEVADRVGGHRSNVSACLHGRLARYKGFTYVYAD